MVILTKDIGIKFEERFAGKTIVRVNISDAVKRADAIMSKIEAHLAQTACFILPVRAGSLSHRSSS